MRRTQATAMAGAAVSLALILSACSSSPAGSESSAPAASAPQASGTASTAQASEAAPASSAAPASAAPSSGFTPEVVPGSGEGVKVGYISLGDSIPFVKLVSDDIKAQAKIAGVDLVFCDSQLDAAKALDCARNFKTQNVQGILNFQLDEKSSPQICAAGPDVPVIAIEVKQKPCQDVFMGADNRRAGEIAGNALGEFFRDSKDCNVDALVSLESPGAGAANTDRQGGAIDAFQAVCGTLPKDKLVIVDGGATIDTGRKKFADVLTSLGDAKNIAVVSLNDDMLLGAFAAAKAANRSDAVFGTGQGADPSSWDAIRNNPGWVGDTAFFPERYGQTAIPAILALISGETVPQDLFTNHVFINKTNIDEFYPQ